MPDTLSSPFPYSPTPPMPDGGAIPATPATPEPTPSVLPSGSQTTVAGDRPVAAESTDLVQRPPRERLPRRGPWLRIRRSRLASPPVGRT